MCNFCLREHRLVPSQVVLARTLSKDNMLQSVATKIAIQLNVKMGGEIWAVAMPAVVRKYFDLLELVLRVLQCLTCKILMNLFLWVHILMLYNNSYYCCCLLQLESSVR